MGQILSQEEVDALLRGISGGEIETETDTPPKGKGIKAYDLTSQERVVRGRMPGLELVSDRFSRLVRSSLTSSLRKSVGAMVVSNEMMKYGDFLKTLPVPTSIHIFRMEPLRGNCILVLESKLVFCLVDIFFGGRGSESFKVEGREFTSIENRLVRKIVDVMVMDLKEAWKSVQPVSFHFVRSEVNPQFATIASSDEIVVVIGFELEIENSTGKAILCIPYAGLEPVKDKLQGGIISDNFEVDSTWAERFKKQLMEVPVEVIAELGTASVTGKELLHLAVGDVIQLNTYSKDALKIKVGGITKFMGLPGVYRGSQAIQITTVLERRY